MNEAVKNWIDNASYEVLLRKWRYATIGDPIFMGDIGKYYAKVMMIKRDALAVGEAVRISKNVGWGNYVTVHSLG